MTSGVPRLDNLCRPLNGAFLDWNSQEKDTVTCLNQRIGAT